jgi:DNA-binding transcriptional regulator YiaG
MPDFRRPRDIERLRELHRLTQRQFGALLGVRAATVSRWESGRHAPSAMAVKFLETRWRLLCLERALRRLRRPF